MCDGSASTQQARARKPRGQDECSEVARVYGSGTRAWTLDDSTTDWDACIGDVYDGVSRLCYVEERPLEDVIPCALAAALVACECALFIETLCYQTRAQQTSRQTQAPGRGHITGPNDSQPDAVLHSPPWAGATRPGKAHLEQAGGADTDRALAEEGGMILPGH